MTGIGAARATLLATILAVLGGCSAFKSPPPLPCPVPGIVEGLGTKIQSSGAAVTTIAWRATMLGFKGGCGYDAEGALVSLDLELAVTPGPAFGSQARKIELPYFVAVADPTGAIVDKQTFKATLDAAPTLTSTLATERLQQRLRGVDAASGPQWRVYLGFELPRAEALGRQSVRP